MEDRTYEALQRKIEELLSIDLKAYKAPQMRRRLESFIRKQVGDVEPLQFIRTLDQRQDVLAELRDMLTINVSEFNRDERQWQLLRDTLLPELLERQQRLRIWSAGCSAGQEPFSLAMLADELGIGTRVQITATDLDRGILARARAGGPYTDADVQNLTAEQRESYFVERDDGLYVVDTIRRHPQFGELNLLRESFKPGYQLICCRHVMIYFSPEIKLALVNKFRQALVPGGFLFVGGTEALLGDERYGLELAGGNFYRKLPEVSAAAA